MGRRSTRTARSTTAWTTPRRARAARRAAVTAAPATPTAMPPVTGAWREGDPPGRRRFADLGPLRLEAGGALPSCGSRTRRGARCRRPATTPSWCCTPSPATATSSGAPGPAIRRRAGGTGWSARASPSTPTGGSSWPRTCSADARGRPGPPRPRAGRVALGRRFPFLTVRDQVAAEVLLADRLGIDRWALVVGGSMGGMRALEWAVDAPARGSSACSPSPPRAYATGDQIAWCARAARGDPRRPGFRGGDYYEAAAGEGPHAGLGRRPPHRARHLPLRAELNLRFGRKAQPGEQPLGRRRAVRGRVLPRPPRRQAGAPVRRQQLRRAHRGDELPRRRPRPRRRGRSAAAGHRADRRRRASTSDRLYPVRLSREIADGVPGALPLRVIDSPYGHDGFLIETGAVAEVLSELLAELVEA